jgi:hypothetical protein
MTRCYRQYTAALALYLMAVITIASHAQTTNPEWRWHTPLPLPLAGHAVALLPNGDLIVAGGLDAGGTATRTSQIYSAATGRFTPALNQLNAARAHHALVSVETASGPRVFAIGGYAGAAGSYRGEASVEVLELDRAAGNWRWRTIGSLAVGRGDLRASIDGAGGIIVGGGRVGGGALRAGALSDATDRIDVEALTVRPIGAMTVARAEHVTALYRAEDRSLKVLVAGGEATTSTTQVLAGSIWDPIANPPVAFRTAAVGVGDPQGIARTFGGFDAAGAPQATTEWYDVKRGWRSAPRMTEPRARFDAALLAGPVDTALAYLAVAGRGTTSALASTEIFELPGSSLPSGAWTSFARLNDAGTERRVAITGANLALVLGGRSGIDVAMAGTEIYQPLRANDVDFGLEEIGRRSDSQHVVIENTWLLPVRVSGMRIDGSAEFLLRGDTADFVLQPGERRAVRLYFQPSVAGEREGRLLFDVGAITDTVILRGRAVASELTVINTPLDFGAQLIGTRRVACLHVLRNDGADTASVDSIIVAPAGAYRLVSPLGRSRVAPGDSLEVCIEFSPSAQGPVTADAAIHIASRRFALQLLGGGTRRYGVATTISSECDTMSYAPGSETSGTIRLENRGDTAITIQAPTITASAPELFRLADPSLFPLTLGRGEAATLDVIFAPQRESREVATLAFANDGDTAISAAVCFVARSRYLSVSQPALDFGDLCAGDPTSALLTVENPSGFDRVELLDAAIDAASGITVSGFSPRTLGPREYVTLLVGYRAGAPGPLAGTVTLKSDRGDVVIPVTADVLRTSGFRARQTPLTIGSTRTITIDAEGIDATQPVKTARMMIDFDATAILPLRVTSIAGGPSVNESASRVQVLGGGRAAVEVSFDGALESDGAAFGLIAETLRGDVDSTALVIGGEPRDGYCARAIETRVDVRGPCVDDVGGVRTAKARFVSASPVPAGNSVAVTIVADADERIRLELADALGRLATTRTITITDGRSAAMTLDVSTLPPGSYVLRTYGEHGEVGTARIVVTR